jgi:hypothetical protein
LLPKIKGVPNGQLKPFICIFIKSKLLSFIIVPEILALLFANIIHVLLGSDVIIFKLFHSDHISFIAESIGVAVGNGVAVQYASGGAGGKSTINVKIWPTKEQRPYIIRRQTIERRIMAILFPIELIQLSLQGDSRHSLINKLPTILQ